MSSDSDSGVMGCFGIDTCSSDTKGVPVEQNLRSPLPPSDLPAVSVQAFVGADGTVTLPYVTEQIMAAPDVGNTDDQR